MRAYNCIYGMACYFILRRLSMTGMRRQVRREGSLPRRPEDSRPMSRKRGRGDGRRELVIPAHRPAPPGQPPDHSGAQTGEPASTPKGRSAYSVGIRRSSPTPTPDQPAPSPACRFHRRINRRPARRRRFPCRNATSVLFSLWLVSPLTPWTINRAPPPLT